MANDHRQTDRVRILDVQTLSDNWYVLRKYRFLYKRSDGRTEEMAREANTIRHIVPLTELILLTSAAEWRVTSVNSDAITPTSISVRPQSYIGASNVQPVIINGPVVIGSPGVDGIWNTADEWDAARPELRLRLRSVEERCRPACRGIDGARAIGIDAHDALRRRSARRRSGGERRREDGIGRQAVPIGDQAGSRIVGSELRSIDSLLPAQSWNSSQITGTRMLHVPFRGPSEAVQALLGGQVDLMFATNSVAVPMVQGGKVRGLAVTSPTRLGALPDLPTVAEAGVTGFEIKEWEGLVAPRGTPTAIVDKWNAELTRVMAQADVRTQLNDLGMTAAAANSPTQFGELIRSQLGYWSQLVKSAGIKAQ